jgi:ElaB/YqjD/DUF883 family membrane-anchored ribosome-binding protein
MSSPEATTEVGTNGKDNFAGDIESLKTSFAQLRTDLTSLLGSAVGIGKSGASVVKEQAAHAVDGVKHRIDSLKEKGADSVEAVEEKISEHPLTVALVAFGIGYVLGKLLSRKG